jgi:hypothetical protein
MNSISDVIAHLANNTPRPGRLCPLIKPDDDALHIGMSTGMGNFEFTPIDECKPLIANTIKQLYESGNLVPIGAPRTFYPGCPLLQRLGYKE